MPVSANTGTKARMMIAIEKKIGRPTSCAALKGDFADFRSIFSMFLRIVLRVADHVLRHDDSRIDQHTDGDGDPAKRHDVR